ncbi:ester cyclase [Paraburkholderia caribensis MBA4]|uniref:Ester cyclase n=1 Tax=Paraburkholderia caribensis MBA4 TaxID=1323664 RepID=A0A0N7JV60_9BURK|nr:ester cyclase [Paraburkholderia caribensis MBA4]
MPVVGNAAEESLPVPHHVTLADNSAKTKSVEVASLRYAAFWNTGDESFAKSALGDDFVDRTLPAGRAPGLEGALQASKAFRAAVPDLTSEVDDMTVVGDRAVLHLHFKGHFTGKFKDLQGSGQTIDFQAFDLYRVQDGKISENWHLEDNLTLLKQLGAIK